MRPSIAIVDSDATTRQTLRALLGALDVEVQLYADAETYLAQAIGKTAAACLIIDVDLAGMSGLQLLKRVRASNAETPVILVTSEPEVSLAVAAMRLGATDFIEKPQLDVALLRRVSQLLRNSTHSKSPTLRGIR